MSPNSQKRAVVVGRLAEKISKHGETMSCLMVKEGDTYQIMAPEDLPICTMNVIQQMFIPYSVPLSLLEDRLKDLHGSVVYGIDEDSNLPTLNIRHCLTIKQESEKHISLNWAAGQISDRVANSILSNLISLNQEKLNMNYVLDSHKQEIKDKAIHDILISLYGDVKLEGDKKFVIMVKNNVAYIDKESGDVESGNEGLKERLTKLYKHIRNRVAVSNNVNQYLRNSPWIPPNIWEDDGTTLEVEARRALSREDQSAFRKDSSQGARRTPPSGGGGNIRTKKIFIGGLSPTLTDIEFRQYFENFGQVTDAVIIYDQLTQHSRGFGFVSFDTEDAVDRVLQKKFHDLNGKDVEVERALPRNANSGSCNRSGGYQNYVSSRRTAPSGGGGNIRTKKIFVGGLSPTLTDVEFRQYFENFGQVTDAVIIYDQLTHHPRGFGFISFDTEDAVNRVLQKNFHDLNGKDVEVKQALPKNVNSGSGNRSGGYQNCASSRGNSGSYENRMD